ncbi:nitroreductase family protein [Methylomonas koyamae]|uniref:nitroreductase family protein n=1 Tax=Methylomonas koyamae TaxID=702114 RepID=UPI002873C3C9|nr:nitroreductase family protein [Methylomonas koyamae]WNB77251.1 nitroreductase family protein [Methylomonas koyamae]
MDSQKIKKIIDAAIQAPSGDNVQPWKLELARDFGRLDIYNLPDLDTSYYNYRQAAAYVAHGALLENITIASRHLGCCLSLHLFPTKDNPDHIATITFAEAEPQLDELYETIFRRSTNRFSFQKSRMAVEDRQRLLSTVQNIEGVNGYLFDDDLTIQKLAKILMVNDQLVFERSDIHRFLFGQIRWTRQEIETSQDGMPVDVLGLSAIEKIFFPLMRHWWFVQAANYLGLSKIIGLKCWSNLRSSSLIGQLTVKKYDRLAFIQAGRALQRVWLEATRQGLAFQPIVGLPLLAYRAKENALTDFSAEHRQIVIDAEKQVRSLLGLDSTEEWLVGFRIGQGRMTRSKTPRRKLLQFQQIS